MGEKNIPDELDAVNSGDRFSDEYGNTLKVLKSELGVTRVEYELPTEVFIDEFERVSDPVSDLLLVERLRDVDMEFEGLNVEGFRYESPISDDRVEDLPVIKTFDFSIRFNLNAIEVGLEFEGLTYEPERFPGMIVSRWGEDDSGFVVLFEDGRGASFAETELVARKRIGELESHIEELGLL